MKEGKRKRPSLHLIRRREEKKHSISSRSPEGKCLFKKVGMKLFDVSTSRERRKDPSPCGPRGQIQKREEEEATRLIPPILFRKRRKRGASSLLNPAIHGRKKKRISSEEKKGGEVQKRSLPCSSFRGEGGESTACEHLAR